MQVYISSKPTTSPLRSLAAPACAADADVICDSTLLICCAISCLPSSVASTNSVDVIGPLPNLSAPPDNPGNNVAAVWNPLLACACVSPCCCNPLATSTVNALVPIAAVSYTHLTLPTICSV